MNTDGYLVPANTKKATLVGGFMRKKPDLLIAGIGTASSLIGLMIATRYGTWITIASLVPLVVSWFLVMPIPYYHNTLCVLQSILEFYQRRKKYIWRGWCMKYEYEKDDKK